MISDTRTSLMATESPRTLEIALENGGTASLSVFEELGRGASCIAYRAIVRGDGIDAGKTCVVKEFFPLGADVRGVRRSSEGLEVPEAERGAFERRERRFRHGSEALLDYFEDDNGHHALPLMDFGRANRTSYAIAYLGSDHLLATDPPKSIHEMAQVMKSICCALEVLHTHVDADGTTDPQLYLDCKPSNLFWYEADGSLHARLFDFDTVVSLASLKDGTCEYASYSPSWASPEQTAWAEGRGPSSALSEASDVYAVGAIFYWLLMGEAPTYSFGLGRANVLEAIDRRLYNWAGLFEKIGGDSMPYAEVVKEIFEGTLRKTPRDRYQSMETLASRFEKLEALSDYNPTTIGQFRAILHEELQLGYERILKFYEALDQYGTQVPAWPSIQQDPDYMFLEAQKHFKRYRECELSWDELSALAQRIAAMDDPYDRLKALREVGFASKNGKLQLIKKTITLQDGTRAWTRLLDYAHDPTPEGGVAGLTFGFYRTVEQRPMNVELTNVGGWEASRARHWLNHDFIEELPKDLAQCLQPVQKLTNNVGHTTSTASVTQTTDKIWLFSATELYGPWEARIKWPNSVECPDYDVLITTEGHQYRLFMQLGVKDAYGFSDRTLKSLPPVIAFDGSSGDFELHAQWYWVRSPDPDNTTCFAIVQDIGTIYNGVGATGNYYIVPGFCL